MAMRDTLTFVELVTWCEADHFVYGLYDAESC